MKRIEKRYLLTENTKRLVSVCAYNEKDVVVEETLYDEHGSTNSIHQFVFDDKFKLIKEIIQDEFNDEPLPVEYSYENDRLTEKKRYYNDGTFEHEKFIYEGNKITHLVIDADGELISKTETSLENGKRIEFKEFDADDFEFATTKNKYNQDDLLIESHYQNKGEDQNVLQSFEYDDKKRLVKSTETNLDSNKIISTGTWIYENDELVKETVQNSNSQPNYFERIYTSSENKLEQQVTTTDGAGTIFIDVLMIFNENKHVIAERTVRSIGTADYGSYQSPMSEFEIEIEYLN